MELQSRDHNAKIRATDYYNSGVSSSAKPGAKHNISGSVGLIKSAWNHVFHGGTVSALVMTDKPDVMAKIYTTKKQAIEYLSHAGYSVNPSMSKEDIGKLLQDLFKKEDLFQISSADVKALKLTTKIMKREDIPTTLVVRQKEVKDDAAVNLVFKDLTSAANNSDFCKSLLSEKMTRWSPNQKETLFKMMMNEKGIEFKEKIKEVFKDPELLETLLEFNISVLENPKSSQARKDIANDNIDAKLAMIGFSELKFTEQLKIADSIPGRGSKWFESLSNDELMKLLDVNLVQSKEDKDKRKEMLKELFLENHSLNLSDYQWYTIHEAMLKTDDESIFVDIGDQLKSKGEDSWAKKQINRLHENNNKFLAIDTLYVKITTSDPGMGFVTDAEKQKIESWPSWQKEEFYKKLMEYKTTNSDDRNFSTRINALFGDLESINKLLESDISILKDPLSSPDRKAKAMQNVDNKMGMIEFNKLEFSFQLQIADLIPGKNGSKWFESLSDNELREMLDIRSIDQNMNPDLAIAEKTRCKNILEKLILSDHSLNLSESQLYTIDTILLNNRDIADEFLEKLQDNKGDPWATKQLNRLKVNNTKFLESKDLLAKLLSSSSTSNANVTETLKTGIKNWPSWQKEDLFKQMEYYTKTKLEDGDPKLPAFQQSILRIQTIFGDIESVNMLLESDINIIKDPMSSTESTKSALRNIYDKLEMIEFKKLPFSLQIKIEELVPGMSRTVMSESEIQELDESTIEKLVTNQHDLELSDDQWNDIFKVMFEKLDHKTILSEIESRAREGDPWAKQQFKKITDYIYSDFVGRVDVIAKSKNQENVENAVNSISQQVLTPEFNNLPISMQSDIMLSIYKKCGAEITDKIFSDDHWNAMLTTLFVSTDTETILKEIEFKAKEGDPWAQQQMKRVANFVYSNSRSEIERILKESPDTAEHSITKFFGDIKFDKLPLSIQSDCMILMYKNMDVNIVDAVFNKYYTDGTNNRTIELEVCKMCYIASLDPNVDAIKNELTKNDCMLNLRLRILFENLPIKNKETENVLSCLPEILCKQILDLKDSDIFAKYIIGFKNSNNKHDIDLLKILQRPDVFKQIDINKVLNNMNKPVLADRNKVNQQTIDQQFLRVLVKDTTEDIKLRIRKGEKPDKILDKINVSYTLPESVLGSVAIEIYKSFGSEIADKIFKGKVNENILLLCGLACKKSMYQDLNNLPEDKALDICNAFNFAILDERLDDALQNLTNRLARNCSITVNGLKEQFNYKYENYEKDLKRVVEKDVTIGGKHIPPSRRPPDEIYNILLNASDRMLSGNNQEANQPEPVHPLVERIKSGGEKKVDIKDPDNRALIPLAFLTQVPVIGHLHVQPAISQGGPYTMLMGKPGGYKLRTEEEPTIVSTINKSGDSIKSDGSYRTGIRVSSDDDPQRLLERANITVTESYTLNLETGELTTDIIANDLQFYSGTPHCCRMAFINAIYKKPNAV